MTSVPVSFHDAVFRILVVVSRPLDLSDLPTIADQKTLLDSLRRIKVPVFIKILRPPTVSEFQQELMKSYDIVHFDGHGGIGIRCLNCDFLNNLDSTECKDCGALLNEADIRSYLAFEKENCKKDLLDANAVAERLQGTDTKLVLLSSCQSFEGAENSISKILMQNGVPVVIGMRGKPSANYTSVFVGPFYAALASRKSIETAFNAGILALKHEFEKSIPNCEYEMMQIDGEGKTLKLVDGHAAITSKIKPPNDGMISSQGTKYFFGNENIPIYDSLIRKNVSTENILEHLRLFESGVRVETHRGSIVEGSANFESELLFGVPKYDFIGDYIRDSPPRGRKGILFQIMDEFYRHRKIVVITGVRGIGKKVLAAEASRRSAWRFKGGVFWRDATDKDSMNLDYILDGFRGILSNDARELSNEEKKSAVLNYLEDQSTPCLIVIIGAEKVKDSSVWDFLEGIPENSNVLLTSLESLPIGAQEIRVEDMEQSEAAKLFVEEARRRSAEWSSELSKKGLECLNDISRILRGHPEAIKLAAEMGSRYDRKSSRGIYLGLRTLESEKQ